jgi:hypothetical protein
MQFAGTFSKLRITLIWKAYAEQKCRFFAWTLLHQKILTAKNLIKRWWPNDPICKLCGLEPEMPQHLCKDCNFTRETWAIVRNWCDITHIQSVNQSGSIYSYWRKCRATFDKSKKKVFNGIIIYFWWNIWKEHNRRTFQQKAKCPVEVATLCKDDIAQYNMAMQMGASPMQ